MYTTKRKFNALLNSLSANNTSSASLPAKQNKATNVSTTTLPSELNTPVKKRRIVGVRPADHPRPRTVHASEPAVNLTPVKANGTHKAPNFAPWDRSQFLGRLKTFRHVDKWSAKPAQVNEVQWAKRGWSCVGKERVGCVGGCGKEVYISLASPEGDVADDDDVEEQWTKGAGECMSYFERAIPPDSPDQEMLAKYTGMIVAEHEFDCLWRRRGCDGKTTCRPCLDAI